MVEGSVCWYEVIYLDFVGQQIVLNYLKFEDTSDTIVFLLDPSIFCRTSIFKDIWPQPLICCVVGSPVVMLFITDITVQFVCEWVFVGGFCVNAVNGYVHFMEEWGRSVKMWSRAVPPVALRKPAEWLSHWDTHKLLKVWHPRLTLMFSPLLVLLCSSVQSRVVTQYCVYELPGKLLN